MEQEQIIKDNVQVNVYRTSKGYRIFFFILMTPFIGLMSWLMVYSIVGKDIDSIGTRILLFAVGFGFNAFLVYAMFSVMKYKVEVFVDKVLETGVFRKKEIIFSEISGFRILPTQYVSYVQFIPEDPIAKKKKIALMMKNSKAFEQWLNTTLKNLDEEDYEKEMQSILSNEELGITEEQRTYTLQRARKLTNFLNIIAMGTSFWLFFRPHPYEAAVWTAIVIPVTAILASRLFPGLIKFDGPQKGAYPTVALPFIIPPIALALRAFLDWSILGWQNFWLPFSVLSMVLFLTTFAIFKDGRKKNGQLVLLLLFCLVYGYSATICLNGIHDDSSPLKHNAIVMDKHFSSGRSTSYYLKLSPWGPRKKEKDVDVSKRLYEEVGISDTVGVYVKAGKFNIPWYFIRKLN